MFARFDRMAKAFTRIGKDIAIAVKNNGPLPENNPKLRAAMQNAKSSTRPRIAVAGKESFTSAVSWGNH